MHAHLWRSETLQHYVSTQVTDRLIVKHVLRHAPSPPID